MDYLGTEQNDVIDQEQLTLPDWTTVYGLGGDDIISVYTGSAIGGSGDDVLIGHKPWSQACYWGSPSGIVVDLVHNEVQDGFGTLDTLQNINNLQGSGQGDIFYGNNENNVFWSSSALDVMDGGDGIDTAVIMISDPLVIPEFIKDGEGCTIHYFNNFGDYRTLETSSVEILSIYTDEGFSDWDISVDAPYLIPDAQTTFEPVPYLADRDQWKITNWGIELLTFTEDSGTWYYPTASDYNAPGNVHVDMHNATLGDFNGDGYQDILLSWVIFPHTIPHETLPLPTLLWGSAEGLVKAEDGTIPATASRHMAYRTITANLNGDNIDDFVIGAMHSPVYEDVDQTQIINRSAPTLAVLGSSDHFLTDISDHLEGQTLTEGNTRGTFDHATAVGDLNGDSIDDIFSGETLWISDRTGEWLDMTDSVSSLLPSGSPMSLAIGDLNNDGHNDILSLYPDFTPERIILFGDGNENPEFIRTNLPEGLYGDNTKDNFAIVVDANYDGLNDIIVSETRVLPYYTGSAIQILIQQSPGVFVDETSTRIDNESRDSIVAGEGHLFYMDAKL